MDETGLEHEVQPTEMHSQFVADTFNHEDVFLHLGSSF